MIDLTGFAGERIMSGSLDDLVSLMSHFYSNKSNKNNGYYFFSG